MTHTEMVEIRGGTGLTYDDLCLIASFLGFFTSNPLFIGVSILCVGIAAGQKMNELE